MATAPGFICPFCSRNFESNKQTTRHIRYCRTKEKHGTSTRRKSCLTCIKAKTRCDTALPSCSRCAKKGLHCPYEFTSVPPNLTVQGASTGQPASVTYQVEAVVSHNSLLKEVASDSTVNIVTSRQGSSHYGTTHLFAGNSFDHVLSADALLDLRSYQGTGTVDETPFPEEGLNLVSLDLVSPNWPFNALLLPKTHQFKDRVVLGKPFLVSIPSSFVSLNTKNILENRDLKAGPYGSALSRAYCISTLRSYPGMMCSNDGTLPPFIHLQPHRATDSNCVTHNEVAQPELFSICKSIMRMYMEKSPGNIAFIWKTIQTESQRIEDEYPFYDAYTVTSAIQCMIIYVILGLLGDDSEYVPDRQILVSILGTTKKVSEKYLPKDWIWNEEAQPEHVPIWGEWVQAESRRRAAIILLIIIHLFNIEHGQDLPICGGFAELSLPCSKSLWQASNQTTWETEYRQKYMRNSSSSRAVGRVPVYRDLLPDFPDPDDPTSNSRMGCLSEWFSEMDDLGTLVTMAVSTL